MTVSDNIGFGLKVRRIPKAERRGRIERAAAILGLSEQLERKPSQLSGGQRQRVAMGRAIVREPQAFLMDEPLSNLDARLRVQMRTEIARIQRELGVTTVYVTHDQVEAMTMADRVAVLRGGILQQVDTPQRVYANPANLFVATFIGSPAMNVVEGRLVRQEDNVICRIGAYPLRLPDALVASQPDIEGAIGQTFAVGLRPEAIALSSSGDGIPGTVIVAEELGSEVIAHVEIEATPIRREEVLEGLDDDGSAPSAGLGGLDPDTTVVVARLPAEAAVRRGTRVTLAIDAGKIHFFDVSDGHTLRRHATSVA
jgi:multiple sugar transport system ATP-binding protein